MTGEQFTAWLWGSGMAFIASGIAFSLDHPESGGAAGTAIVLGVILCARAYLSKS
ncbi:hypothetical protein [Martelella radicis]|uniref:Uncharacterized protein n=1 Tax=Martelella radicis TaxID=1397476 RepID=A0A7W6KPU3_9HYPH|nr:hypothetical protein [Martelella radicis]MBB4123964.1 hypothetical protein [Martelella radicis]